MLITVSGKKHALNKGYALINCGDHVHLRACDYPRPGVASALLALAVAPRSDRVSKHFVRYPYQTENSIGSSEDTVAVLQT